MEAIIDLKEQNRTRTDSPWRKVLIYVADKFTNRTPLKDLALQKTIKEKILQKM